MQLDLPFLQARPPERAERADRVEFVRVRKARRYILRVRPDGTLRVTVPRGGSRAGAAAFVARHLEWVAKERARVQREQTPVRWTDGSVIQFAGMPCTISVQPREGAWFASYADRVVRVTDPSDVRPDLERDLRELARTRLVPRLLELAAVHDLPVGRVTVRNQRSRWGSCSRRGTIALNFRLLQMPPDVCEYVLIHELMHIRHHNHGSRFWAAVERACPDYEEAERWLRRNGRALF